MDNFTSVGNLSTLIPAFDNFASVVNATQGPQPAPPPAPELSALDRVLLMPDDQYKLAERIQLIFRYVIMACAVPLTLCNITVFLQPGMRSSTGTYVVCISIAQILYIGISSGIDISNALYSNPLRHYSWCFYYLYILVFVGLIAKRGTYLVMLLVSVERFYAIVRPFHIKEFLLARFPLTCTLAAFLVTALWHVYLPTRTIVITVNHPVLGPMCSFSRTNLYLKMKEVNDFFSFTSKIVLSYGGLFGQLVLNALTIWALRRHRTANKNMKTSSDDDVKAQRERQMTRTILAATICYLAFSFPSVFHDIMSTIFKEYFSGGKYYKIYDVVGSFSWNLAILSSAIDFVCFYVMSAGYRNTFHKMISRGRKTPGLPAQEDKTETTQTS